MEPNKGPVKLKKDGTPDKRGKELHPALEKNKWKKGQSGNPFGRQPETVRQVGSTLLRMGYEPMSIAAIRQSYMLIVTLDEKKIAELMVDKRNPMFIRIIAKRILAKDGFEIIEKMIDRVYGKPKQEIHTVDSTTEIDLTKLSASDLANLALIQEKIDEQNAKIK